MGQTNQQSHATRTKDMSPEEIQSQVAKKANQDLAFRTELIADPRAAVERLLGLQLPAGLVPTIQECPLDSVFLALPPLGTAVGAGASPLAARALQDAAFRAELLTNPRAVLEKELGQPLPPGTAVEVVEVPANALVIALAPHREAGELTDEDLETVAGGLGYMTKAAIGMGIYTGIFVLAVGGAIALSLP